MYAVSTAILAHNIDCLLMKLLMNSVLNLLFLSKKVYLFFKISFVTLNVTFLRLNGQCQYYFPILETFLIFIFV